MITSTARNWWSRRNSAKQHQNFLLFAIHSLDCLTTQLNEAGQDFGSHSGIEDDDITRVAKADYEVVTIAAAEDLKDAKKWIRRQIPCAIVPSLTITSGERQRPPKKPRIDDQAGGGASRGTSRRPCSEFW